MNLNDKYPAVVDFLKNIYISRFAFIFRFDSKNDLILYSTLEKMFQEFSW